MEIATSAFRGSSGGRESIANIITDALRRYGVVSLRNLFAQRSIFFVLFKGDLGTGFIFHL